MAAQRQRGQLAVTVESTADNATWLHRFPPGREVVYFINGGGATKIGYTNNLRERLLALQHAAPWPLRIVRAVLGSQGLELRAHAYFRTARIHGEWFEIGRRRIHEFADAVERGEEPGANHWTVKRSEAKRRSAQRAGKTASQVAKEQRVKSGVQSAHMTKRAGRLVTHTATPEELDRMRG